MYRLYTSRQRGAFLMARDLLVVAILLALLLVPYMRKELDSRQKAKGKPDVAAGSSIKAPATAASGPSRGAEPQRSSDKSLSAASPGQESGSRSLGHGLTYGLDLESLPPFGDPVSLACRSTGEPLERPHQGACNPVAGDTSCRMVLPLLCTNPGQTASASSAAAGAGNRPLGATQPVMGAVLASHALASQRCEKELGAGWRAADTQDALGGVVKGVRDSGLRSPSRYWVISKGSDKGNCWSSNP